MSDSLRLALSPISDSDIAWVCTVMRLPSNAFGGGEDARLSVMRSLETLDIEACPGSGKTTLLVAKLAILANQWRSRRQGICVLSHTNAARTEIGDRLSSTSAGHLLLRHPHFIGTIHSFVNEYLAIPWLRSKGRLIKAIDTEIALNNRWYSLPWGTRSYLERQHDGPASLTYTRSDYADVGNGKYSVKSDTYKNMLKACQESVEAGYYCFDEMFVWASELLDRFPSVTETIRKRFPLVFIDEVQDNSEVQSAFIHRLFMAGETPVIRQRFGDSNQAIYHRTGISAAATDVFPGPSKVDLQNSHRFSQAIADLAAPLGIRPQALVGTGPTMGRVDHPGCQSALFLFDDESVLDVLPAYGAYLIESFTPESLSKGNFSAIAGVHKAEKHDNLPRFMGHYMPEYDPEVSGKQPKPSSLAQYLARARLEAENSGNVHPIVNLHADGVVHFLRLCGHESPLTIRKSAHRYLLELLENHEARTKYLAVVDKLVECRGDLMQNDWTNHIVPAVLEVGEAITSLKVKDKKVLAFLAWPSSSAAGSTEDTPRRTINLFKYPPEAPKVSIRLGSIHGVKGETHTATLVLESFQKAHHLNKLKPWLLGKKPKAGKDNSGEDAALLDRLKLHYVAMTRPSHMLCLAMRKDSFKPAELDLMRNRNWHVIDCCRPSTATPSIDV